MGESGGGVREGGKETEKEKTDQKKKKQISEYASKTLNDYFLSKKAFFKRTNKKFWHFTPFSLFIKSFYVLGFLGFKRVLFLCQ